MDAWRMVGFGLGIAASACVVEFDEDRPVYEVDTGTPSSSSTSSGNNNSGNNSSGGDGNSSSNNGSTDAGGNGNSSSNGTGGTGGDESSSQSNSGGSSTNGTGGDPTTNSSGGSPSTTNGSAGATTTTSGGGTGGATGGVDDCEGTDTSCSACNNVTCTSAPNCCADVSFFAAQSYPEWIEMPEIVTSYNEQNTVTLNTNFTGYNQVAAIAYLLDYDMLLYYALTIDASVSGGWTMTVSLEDRLTESGCVYTVGTTLDAYALPDNCWGDLADFAYYPSEFYFNQINVRIESLNSGSGTGALTIDGMVLE